MFFHNKRCVVTGGAGFVGRHVARALTAAGASVRVSRHQRDVAGLDQGVEVVDADLRDQNACRRLLAGADCVFHCAGAVGAAGVSPMSAMSGLTVNLTLTANVLEAAWAAGVGRVLLFGSSTGYPVADHPVREDEMWSGPPFSGYFGYGWMRRYLERLGEFVHSQPDAPAVVVVRPTAVYGPGDNFDPASCHVIPALINRALAGETPFTVWGTGEEVRDFLHITDLARGCMLAMEKLPTCDPVNIGYGQTTTIRQVVEIILAAAGHNAPVTFQTDRPTAIPVRSVNVDKARDLLGFRPALSLRDGLVDTVRWRRAHYGKDQSQRSKICGI